MFLNNLKKNFENKKILILGFGKEGKDSYLVLRKLFPKKILGIADQNENVKCPISNVKKIKYHLGKDYLLSIKDYDVIIKSPGISFKSLLRPDLGKITSQTEIFFDNCPGKIVGITGTKGKGTTASIVCKILKAGGVKAHLIGNIGKPVLNFLFSTTPEDVYVYELSSHQLYNLKKSPHIAVFLNLFADHLDYYKNFEDYANAKTNIALHQKKDDYLVYNIQDKIVKKISKKSKAKKIPIKGEYYKLNREAAIAVAKIFKIDSKIIEKTIKNFKTSFHRLELFGVFKEITFYNDSAATIPEATMAAIQTLGNKIETIILGGSNKNVNFEKLTKKILQSKIKTLILFPSTGEKIWREIIKLRRGLTPAQLPKHFFIDNMQDAIKLSYQHTKKGKICLLSPASASFGIFKNYKERGNLFKKYVKYYGSK
ncbi:hypothetical protein COY61_00875 [bacterium (Candidatus Gribaldobacteria) CG_4_10_14_0_8_um_filter_33_9]|uniref:UDP-N-acetylmuramoylalanine--D-glutamate ligase n=1 Tax=bacterium (Candidatus Gribaldobacteria) CG_4_10_14_0_8_um_filter_33_9 TaxID=2014266 RepID=A0A2M7RNG1_9BACT|nr:MAG: hypothetical protein COY61_00875 [bacterium (Candidatus Gribaldobacteria) CG_4_10_14_0_8_um_filter_33_9]